MNTKPTILACTILAVSLVLSACAAPNQPSPITAPALSTTQPAQLAQPIATQPVQPAASQPTKPAGATGDLTRSDTGGAVTFEVKPLDLGSNQPTLDFEIGMNTHSVELGNLDLKQLAVLKTDTGAEIAPSAYQGGGGHHVAAKLSFPADKLAGAKALTLLIKNVAGVPERTFTWNLQ